MIDEPTVTLLRNARRRIELPSTWTHMDLVAIDQFGGATQVDVEGREAPRVFGLLGAVLAEAQGTDDIKASTISNARRCLELAMEKHWPKCKDLREFNTDWAHEYIMQLYYHAIVLASKGY